ncbi:hypothetical protein [Variovorax sp. LT1R16]|uniref:hypothetical protein n=1 Tax=Variovorax sp. LT1R16 TaxID=3443728 RepID=UPI003F480817
MKISILALAIAIWTLGNPAHAQPAATDKAQARAERKAAGTAAARSPQIGEGNPVPDARPKALPGERAAARQARKEKGSLASHGQQQGEGDPLPAATAKVPRAERAVARQVRRTEAARANKAGEIKAKGESSY